MPQTRLQRKSRHFKLTVAYDGTGSVGWQLQPNGKTIQGAVEAVLAKITGRAVRVHGSGRTDAGVHARQQVANCSCNTQLNPRVLARALNANLPKDIRVTRVQKVDAKFHARFSAKSKEYRYQVDCGAVADPFLRAYAWHHPHPLNILAMRRAVKLLKGRHDFSALSANPMRPAYAPKAFGASARRRPVNPVRTISGLTVSKRGDLLTISVAADGFLYKMVRSIVGALVKVGEGKLTAEQLAQLLRGRKRTALVETAPAHGLFLWRVFY